VFVRRPGQTTLAKAVVSALALLAASTVAAGCGDGGAPGDGEVRLIGTEIPTVFVTPVPTPVCAAENPLPLPPNFPPRSEILLPEDYRISEVETSPYLRVVGTTQPPENPDEFVQPYAVVGTAMGEALLNRGWMLNVNDDVEGIDYNFSDAGGRMGHYNTQPVPGCPGYVRLIIDLAWITPGTTSAPPARFVRG
jgi:hypothetical protein